MQIYLLFILMSVHSKIPVVNEQQAVTAAASRCRFSTDADTGPGSEPLGSARRGHHPQRPLLNSDGETEQPLDPSTQWSCL